MSSNSMELVCCHAADAAAAAAPRDAAAAARADAGDGGDDDDLGGAQELLQELDVKTRLRTALEMYEETLEDLKNHGLLEQLQRLEGKEATEFFDRLKERIESKSFLEKLCGHLDVSERKHIGKKSSTTSRDHTSWLLIDKDDTFKSEDEDNEGYVMVTQDDIVDGIACFMAKYMSVVPKAKELSPQELQKAVSKALGTLHNKGKIKKLWNYGKVLYTAASWSATAVGFYNNPPVSRDALMYMWTTICILIQSMK